MIIVTLLGGLGNQMFQYALGRSLSVKLKTELVLNLISYSHDPIRSYQLNYFPIHARICSEEDSSRIIPYEGLIKQLDKRWKLLISNKIPIKIIQEKSLRFEPDILKTPDNTNLLGYWQSEKYFSETTDIIQTDFLFPKMMSIQNSQCLEAIEKTKSVSMHIRRGDYILNPTTYSYHGVCSKDYYYSAMSLIEEKLDGPEYFVFTDDPQWAKNYITTMHPITFIDWNDCIPHEDLRLMASCKHHIIANSSFSWWGAWLRKKEKQIVIAPEPWYDSTVQDTPDIYLESWIKLRKNPTI